MCHYDRFANFQVARDLCCEDRKLVEVSIYAKYGIGAVKKKDCNLTLPAWKMVSINHEACSL